MEFLFKISPALVIIGMVGAVFAFPWKNADARRRTVLSFVLFVPPLSLVVWDLLFHVPSGTRARPAWISGFLDVPVWFSLALPVVVAVKLKGARLFVSLLGLALFPVTLLLDLATTMSVTGVWL
jgi:hypothetical protein